MKRFLFLFSLLSIFFVADTNAKQVQAQTPVPVIDNWQLKGNLGTDSNMNFVGTIDNVPLIFRTNNQVQAQLFTTGTFLIPKTATVISYPINTTISPNSSAIVVNSVITGALNITPLAEKGRTFIIANYSGTTLTLNTPIKTSASASTTAIPNGNRWEIIYDGLTFIRIL